MGTTLSSVLAAGPGLVALTLFFTQGSEPAQLGLLRGTSALRVCAVCIGIFDLGLRDWCGLHSVRRTPGVRHKGGPPQDSIRLPSLAAQLFGHRRAETTDPSTKDTDSNNRERGLVKGAPHAHGESREDRRASAQPVVPDDQLGGVGQRVDSNIEKDLNCI